MRDDTYRLLSRYLERQTEMGQMRNNTHRLLSRQRVVSMQ
jgi:hypothetical protein